MMKAVFLALLSQHATGTGYQATRSSVTSRQLEEVEATLPPATRPPRPTPDDETAAPTTIWDGVTAAPSTTISGETETITGFIYCDNVFEFYFNGALVAKDPLTFTPHNAVKVSFEYDGVSPKHYAIMCMDYATRSGYEYTSTLSPGLGDGALIAEFSDGVRTSAEWSVHVVTSGPTDASIADGCSASNLCLCVVEDFGMPPTWASPRYDFSAWAKSTSHTADEAGWGRTPTWSEFDGCCSPLSPMTKLELGCCSCNYDVATGQVLKVDMIEAECLDPQEVFSSSKAAFIWSADLQKDNKLLFRYTAPATTAPTIEPSRGLPRRETPSSTTSSTDDVDNDEDEDKDEGVSWSIDGAAAIETNHHDGGY